MKKSWLIILSCILLASLIFTGCGSPQTSTVTATSTSVAAVTSTATSVVVSTTTTIQQQIIINIGGGMPPGHAISVSILDWKSKLEAAAKGRVKVTFYEAGTMAKSADLYDACVSGTLQAAHMAEFWAGGRFPIVEGVDSLPFTFTGLSQQTQTMNALIDRGLASKEIDPFKFLYFTSVGTVNIFTAKTKINTMADFKGQKLRASGVNVKTVELLGGQGLTVPGEEEYMDIQKGILTGNLTGSDNAVGRKEYEVLKYGILNPISTGGFLFVMNKNFWNSLPADIQAIIDNLNKEEAAAHITAQTAAQSKAWDTLKANNMEIYSIAPDELAKWRDATSSVSSGWIKTISDKGLPGDKIMATIKEITGTK
jgi:TRAP-type transport system periplasmic protein